MGRGWKRARMNLSTAPVLHPTAAALCSFCSFAEGDTCTPIAGQQTQTERAIQKTVSRRGSARVRVVELWQAAPSCFSTLEANRAPAVDWMMATPTPAAARTSPKIVCLAVGRTVIPASRSLESLDQILGKQPKIRPEKNFARALNDLTASFDYVFVDTAPNLTTPTVIAYNTVPWFILTARPGKTAMDSLSDAVQDLLQVKQFGAEGRLLGVVLTEVDIRTRLSKDIVQLVEDEFQATLENKTKVKLGFENHISKTIAIEEAPYAAQTIFDYRSNSRACAEYEALAEEMELRLKNFEKLFGAARGQADVKKLAANE